MAETEKTIKTMYGEMPERDVIRTLVGELEHLIKLMEWERKQNTRLREALQPFACKCEGDWCEKLLFNDDKAKCEHYTARFALGERG